MKNVRTFPKICQDILFNLSRHFFQFVRTFFLLPQQMFFLRQNTGGKLIQVIFYYCCFKMFSKAEKLRFTSDGFVPLQKNKPFANARTSLTRDIFRTKAQTFAKCYHQYLKRSAG